MMIKASEANKMVKEAIEKARHEQAKRLEKFCEKLSTMIIERAKEQKSTLEFETPTDIDVATLAETLRSNGYSTTVRTDNKISIVW